MSLLNVRRHLSSLALAVACAIGSTSPTLAQDETPPPRPTVAWNPERLEKLPDDVVSLSAMELGKDDLAKLTRFEELRHLHLVTTGVVFGPEEGRLLGTLPKLESLNLFAVRIEPRFFQALGARKTLHTLSLFCDYADGIWSELSHFPALTTLGLKEPQLRVKAMKELVKAARSLTTFTLKSDVVMTAEALMPLRDLKKLRVLDLSRSEGVNSDVVNAVVADKPLEHLGLSGCRRVDGKAVATLHSLVPTLRSLSIDGTSISAVELSELVRDMARLESLDIGGDGFKSVVFEPQIMAALKTCRRLESLGFVYFEKIELDALKPLRSMNLKALSLYGSPLDAADLKTLFAGGPQRLRLPNGRWITLRR